MAVQRQMVAIDCGAESGRAIIGAVDADSGRCHMQEVHRFANGGRFVDGVFRWDWQRLCQGLADGIAAARRSVGGLASIGIDTWGVDYGLLDAAGALIEEPIHYRDERGARHLARLDERVPAGERFRATGIRQMVINTLDQLHAERCERPELLQRAARLLFMPDLLAWELTGAIGCEWTIASTSACYRPGAREPATALLQALDLPSQLFGTTETSGHRRGLLAERFGAGPVPVLASAGHDTAAAVAALPVPPGESCYLVSGTWSLMGTVCDQPLLDEATATAGLTNELAWDGRFRLLKNIMGLWIVQECRRAFAAAGRSYDYAQLTRLAAMADDPVRPLAVDDVRFLGPGTDADPMPARVQGWYAERGLTVPADGGAIVRAVLLGLAAAYATCFNELMTRTGRRFDRLHVIGGGCQNDLLCRLTAAACGVPVIAGPVEATALGNLLVQAVGLGAVTADELPGVVARSVDCRHYDL